MNKIIDLVLIPDIQLTFSIEGSHRITRKFQKFSSICAAAIGWQIGESARGIGEDVEELWCETHGPASLLVRADDKFAFAFRKGRREVTRRERTEGMETEFSTLDSVSRPAGTLPRRNQLLYSSSKHCYVNIRITRRREYGPCRQAYSWECMCVD